MTHGHVSEGLVLMIYLKIEAVYYAPTIKTAKNDFRCILYLMKGNVSVSFYSCRWGLTKN